MSAMPETSVLAGQEKGGCQTMMAAHDRFRLVRAPTVHPFAYPSTGLVPARDDSRPCIGRFLGDVREDVDMHVIGEAGPVVAQQLADYLRVLTYRLLRLAAPCRRSWKRMAGRPDR